VGIWARGEEVGNDVRRELSLKNRTKNEVKIRVLEKKFRDSLIDRKPGNWQNGPSKIRAVMPFSHETLTRMKRVPLMNAKKILLLIAAFLCWQVLVPLTAQANTITANWVGGGGSSSQYSIWDYASNWSNGAYQVTAVLIIMMFILE
jgi:hypothetical protein